MMRLLVLVALLSSLPGFARGQGSDSPLAPELTGLGTIHVEVTTALPNAQQFFDQGLRLLYAFNHQESLRAFREAARLDPRLAMAYWGQAMALGPNLNAPMTADNGRLAHEAIARAVAVAGAASARERALVQVPATPRIRPPTGKRSTRRTRARWARWPRSTRMIRMC
jgi:hypothetical protein